MAGRGGRYLLLGLLFVLALPGMAGAAGLKEGVEQLVAELAKSVREGQRLTVAVTNFQDLQGATSDLGRYIAERLTTRLSQNPKFSVVERRRLGQVLGELKFSQSDLLDPAKAKKVGQLVGVEAIVVGSYSDLGQNVDLDARMIEIATARTLPGASVTISKDPVVIQLMERGREVEMAAPPMGPSPASPAPVMPSPAAAVGRIQAGGLRVQDLGVMIAVAHSAEKGKRGAAVFVSFTNKTREVIELGLAAPCSAQLSDDVGTEYQVIAALGFSDLWSGVCYSFKTYKDGHKISIEPGATASTSFVFEPRTTDQPKEKPKYLSVSAALAGKVGKMEKGFAVGLSRIPVP